MSNPPSIVLNVSRAAIAIGGAPILRDLDFALTRGEWTFVLGPPGAGKTTLLRLAAGAIKLTSGAIDLAARASLVLHDTPLDDKAKALEIVAGAMAESADRSQHLPADPSVYPSPLRGGEGEGVAQSRKATRPPTPGEIGFAEFADLPHKGGGNSAPIRSDDMFERAESLLRDLGLDAYLGHEPFRLSRGFRKRLEIARALGSGATLLCLDDPFSPMDQGARRRTAHVLRRSAQKDGLAILMVGNDPLDALLYGDRVIVLSPGPAAHVAAIHAVQPRPDVAPADLAATPLCAELEAALWDEGA